LLKYLLVGLLIVTGVQAAYNDSIGWRLTMNDTALDSAGTSACNISTPGFGYTTSTAAPGPFTTSAVFSSNVTYSTTNIPATCSNSLATMTLCTWVKKSALNVQYNVYVKGDTVYRVQFGSYEGATHNDMIYFKINGVGVLSSVNGLENTAWNWICTLHNSTGKYIYLNATQVNSTATTGTTASSGVMSIGSSGENDIERFAGQLSDSIMWTRSVNPSELTSMFNNYIAGRDPFTDAVTNSCTYTSGNWRIDVKDDCNITTSNTMGRATLTINGSTDGNFHRIYVNGGRITNFANLTYIGVNTTLWGLLG
jgi:hypothetical protein